MRCSTLVVVALLSACQESAGGGTVAQAVSDPPTCSHGSCVAGAPLGGSCDPCTAAVCKVDAACCTDGWDAKCVSLVDAVCSATCAVSCPVPSAPAVVDYTSWDGTLPPPVGGSLTLVVNHAPTDGHLWIAAYDPILQEITFVLDVERSDFGAFMQAVIGMPFKVAVASLTAGPKPRPPGPNPPPVGANVMAASGRVAGILPAIPDTDCSIP